MDSTEEEKKKEARDITLTTQIAIKQEISNLEESLTPSEERREKQKAIDQENRQYWDNALEEWFFGRENIQRNCKSKHEEQKQIGQ